MIYEKGRAWIELDLDNLHHNVKVLRSMLPKDCELMPVLKANAYGHGAVLIARELNKIGVQNFCVATVSEAVELREYGIQGHILILGYTHPQQFKLLCQYDLTQTVVDMEHATVLNEFGQSVQVHIAVDTGMHRLGERSDDLEKILQIFQMENLTVTGLFTHLCTDDTDRIEDQVYAKRQVRSFYELVEKLRRHGYAPPIHVLSTYGLLNYPEFGGSYARIGIALYGVLSHQEDLDRCGLDLHPVLSVKARVVTTKKLSPGEGVGYGLTYVADCETRIAVISVGYADGIPRRLSCCHGKVLINGSEAPIIGRICMDQMIVELSDTANVKSGDVAVIIGSSDNQNITAYEMAKQCGTITNEILSRLGERLNRVCI